MATAQGFVKVAGVNTPGVYYTAIYSRPGNVTRWRRVVRLTDNAGIYQVAISEDNFMGTNWVCQNGDKLVVLFWRKSDVVPVDPPGSVYENQSPADGSGGDHPLGFKYDNGAAAVANYATADQFASVLFTLTGDAWNATPDGGGVGDINGNIDLQLNQGPSAVITGVSTDPLNPTEISRAVARILSNGSGDNENRVTAGGRTTGQFYSEFSQILFEQISGAHRPSGGVQTADGSAVDGTRFVVSTGSRYGNSFGTLVAGPSGTLVGDTQVVYPGPGFPSQTHTWTHIDIWPVQLTSRDDAGVGAPGELNPSRTATVTFYLRTAYRAPGFSLLARQWASWTDLVAHSGSPVFSSEAQNTIRDVALVTPALSGADNTIVAAARYQDAPAGSIVALNGVGRVAIRNDPWSGGQIYARFAGDTDLSTAIGGNLTVDVPGIGRGIQAGDLAVGEIRGFLNAITQTPVAGGVATPILHAYPIVASSSLDSVVIATGGSTEVYTAMDWFFISNEPGGGNHVSWEWEVNTSGMGWESVGLTYSQLGGSAVGPGTTINSPGIGAHAWPGAFFVVVNGGMRGWYPIASVPNDDQIVLVIGSPLPGLVQPSDTIAIGFPSKPLKWPQGVNDALDVRAAVMSTPGWSVTPGMSWRLLGSSPVFYTQTGAVSNLNPAAIIPSPASVPGNAKTYVFDGRRSYGTDVVWTQGDPLGTDPVFAAGGTILAGHPSIAFTDPNLINGGLRTGGHAVLVLVDPAGSITKVIPIVDTDKTDPTKVWLNTSTLGVNIPYGAGVQRFRTANDYEIEPGGSPSAIATYAWELRSSPTPLPPLGVNDPGFMTWWNLARFDNSGDGSSFSHTYPQADSGRNAVVALTVVDEDTAPGSNAPAQATSRLAFVVNVSGGGSTTLGARRLEWD
jgi:hypothetical protein